LAPTVAVGVHVAAEQADTSSMKRPWVVGLLLGAGVGFCLGLAMMLLGSFATIWQSLAGEGSWASDFIVLPIPAMVIGGVVGLIVAQVVGKRERAPAVPPPPPPVEARSANSAS
jgi:hypothetical protein